MKKRKIRINRTPKLFKKRCRLCSEKVTDIDYKDVTKLNEFISKKSRILSRGITGNCSKHQKRIVKAIKRARYMALLPYISE